MFVDYFLLIYCIIIIFSLNLFTLFACTYACVCMSDDGCEELKFTRLMDSHVCYDLMPYTSKLVVFDTQLTVNADTHTFEWVISTKDIKPKTNAKHNLNSNSNPTNPAEPKPINPKDNHKIRDL